MGVRVDQRRGVILAGTLAGITQRAMGLNRWLAGLVA